VLRTSHVVVFLHRAVGLVCSFLNEGILHDYLRRPRLRANPANVLVDCVLDELAPVVLVEGQESRIPTVNGNVVQLRDPDNGVKSVAGSPILAPVACDIGDASLPTWAAQLRRPCALAGRPVQYLTCLTCSYNANYMFSYAGCSIPNVANFKLLFAISSD
jgi:hypothetical protein